MNFLAAKVQVHRFDLEKNFGFVKKPKFFVYSKMCVERYFAGESPVCFLNIRLKCSDELKPRLLAIWFIDISVVIRRYSASLIFEDNAKAAGVVL